MRIALVWLAALGLLGGCTPDVRLNGVGGAGGDSTSASMSTATFATTSTGSSTSSGVPCTNVATCPESPSECEYPICNGLGRCDFAAESTLATCEGGSKHCDGAGNCVECNGDQDCTGSGQSCSALHTCVSAQCVDMTKDGQETDIDCGGGSCPGCGNMLKCVSATDCLSNSCDGTGHCIDCTAGNCPTGRFCGGNSGVCEIDFTQGAKCTSSLQCGTGNCVEGVCCDGACGGGCDSCLGANQGGVDGACGHVVAGQDPKSVCTATMTSCVADSCNGSGACGVQPTSSVCAAPSCSNDTYYAASNCDGATNNCPTVTGTTCANNLTCNAGGTDCNTACSATGAVPHQVSVGCVAGYSCEVISHTCTVTGTQQIGDDCTNDYECASGQCDKNGQVCV